MTKLIEHVAQQALPNENRGLPTLNLDECERTGLPMDWDIIGVFGDILMCKYVDENPHGEVLRNGIYLKQEVTQNLWRVVEVLIVGPSASKNVNVGDLLMIPGDRGIPGLSKDGTKLIFINEPRAFAKVKPNT